MRSTSIKGNNQKMEFFETGSYITSSFTSTLACPHCICASFLQALTPLDMPHAHLWPQAQSPHAQRTQAASPPKARAPPPWGCCCKFLIPSNLDPLINKHCCSPQPSISEEMKFLKGSEEGASTQLLSPRRAGESCRARPHTSPGQSELTHPHCTD